MYSLENAVQPDVFRNAFSGFWWAVSTLLTVGYGDIYPITIPGRIFGIIITFLGVGMVAIPTGIISAGFVDQYSRIKRISEYAHEADIHFIKVHLSSKDPWARQTIQELGLPTTLRQLGMTEQTPLEEIASSVILTSGGYGRLTRDDVLAVFRACF